MLTDRLLVEGCNVIQVAGLGDATVLAEDDKSVRDSLVRALTFEGYDVSTA